MRLPLHLGMIKRIFWLAIAAIAPIVHPVPASAQAELVVYSAMEPDEVKIWSERFHKENPGIRLSIIRNSTGALTAKILAEKNNPQADVIWRLANTSLIAFDNQNMIERYKPAAGYEKLDPRFKDKLDPPAWVGVMAYMAAVCFNTVEAQKKGLPTPKSWKDLTNPVYKGQIVMPNPNSSGTGFLDASAWLQTMGEEKAWEYMDALDKNIALYTHSGSKPCAMAASGEYPVGISWAFRAATLKNKGAPIDVIYPSEGLGWDLEGNAIMKGTKKLEAAKKFLDWSISRSAMELYAEAYPTVGIPAMAKQVPHYPADINKMLIKNDFWWAAANRDRILNEWLRRYNTKTEQR